VHVLERERERERERFQKSAPKLALLKKFSNKLSITTGIYQILYHACHILV